MALIRALQPRAAALAPTRRLSDQPTRQARGQPEGAATVKPRRDQSWLGATVKLGRRQSRHALKALAARRARQTEGRFEAPRCELGKLPLHR